MLFSRLITVRKLKSRFWVIDEQVLEKELREEGKISIDQVCYDYKD
jgi:hypothetical protein